jgi:hypothetical protein
VSVLTALALVRRREEKMTVLVTAASKHGATREIAEAIARVLDENRVPAELVGIDEVRDLARYKAVVLGVYMGRWLREARSFVDAHADELTRLPTWLFSSGPIVGDPPTPDLVDEAAGRRALETTQALRRRGVLHSPFVAGWRNRLGVDLNWIWSYATHRRAGLLLIGEPSAPAEQPAQPIPEYVEERLLR